MKQQRKNLLYTILICFFLLLFIMIFLFSNTRTGVLLVTGQQAILSGKIYVDNNYPIYTHSLKHQEGDILIHLKSKDINLNQILDTNVLIGGTVLKMKNNEAIVDVSTVQNLNKGFILTKNSYISPENFFVINIDDDINIHVDTEHSSSTVYYDDIYAFSVRTFICNKVIEQKNCEKIKSDLVRKYVQTFNSPLGYQFLQLSDTQWYVFDDISPVAYLFSTKDEEYLIDLSYAFIPLDGKYFLENKREYVFQKCAIADEGIKDIFVKKESIRDNKYLKLDLLFMFENPKIKEVPCELMVDVSQLSFWIK